MDTLTKKKENLTRLLLAPLAVIGFWIGVEALLEEYGPTSDLLKSTPILRTAPYLLAVALLVGVEKLFSGQSWKNTYIDFGFRSPRNPQLKIGLIGIVILAIGYTLAFSLLGQSPELKPNWPNSALKFFLEAGIVEELLFRGFLFRKIREQWSFLQAAAISGAIFGCAHLMNLMNGISTDVLLGVAISVTFGFFMAFPFAALFEVGGNALAGGIAFHFAVDSINLFQGIGSAGMLACLGIAAFAGLVVFLLAHRKLPVH